MEIAKKGRPRRQLQGAQLPVPILRLLFERQCRYCGCCFGQQPSTCALHLHIHGPDERTLDHTLHVQWPGEGALDPLLWELSQRQSRYCGRCFGQRQPIKKDQHCQRAGSVTTEKMEDWGKPQHVYAGQSPQATSGPAAPAPLLRPDEPTEAAADPPMRTESPIEPQEPPQLPLEVVEVVVWQPVVEQSAPQREEPTAGPVAAPPPPDLIVPPAVAKLRRRLSKEVGLFKLHVKHYRVNVPQFKARTSELALPKEVYDLFGQAITTCSICAERKPPPARY